MNLRVNPRVRQNAILRAVWLIAGSCGLMLIAFASISTYTLREKQEIIVNAENARTILGLSTRLLSLSHRLNEDFTKTIETEWKSTLDKLDEVSHRTEQTLGLEIVSSIDEVNLLFEAVREVLLSNNLDADRERLKTLTELLVLENDHIVSLAQVVVNESESRLNAMVERLWLMLTVFVLGVSAVAFTLVVLAKRRILKPLINISEVSAHYQKTQEFKPFKHEHDDEFGSSIELVNEMFAALQAKTSALEESRQLLESSSSLTGVGGWSYNFDSKKFRLTHGSSQILGLSESTHELSLDLCTELFHDSETLELATAAFKKVVDSNQMLNIELPLKNFKGQTIWVQLHGVLTTDNKKMTGAIQDVTSQKLQTEQLSQALQYQTDINKNRAEFVAQLSHEVRTPLNAMLGLIHLLKESKLDNEQVETIRTVESAGRSLVTLVSNVLDVEKLDAGELRIDSENFCLGATVQDIKEVCAGLRKKDVQIQLSVDPLLSKVSLKGDEPRLRQVLMNLIGNALKFTDQGNVTLHLKLIDINRNRARVQFRCKDTGIGMNSATIQNLFQPFRQAENAQARQASGTGIGLYLSQRLVQSMGGEIEVSSKPGVGSEFYWTLDFELGQQSDPMPAAIPALQEAKPTRMISGRKVLIVDDNALNLKVLGMILVGRGAEVIEAKNGREALNLLNQPDANFDICLMDVQMPVMDGLEATRLIRQTPHLCRLPVIALTAAVTQEQMIACSAAGMDELVGKPFEVEKLIDLVASSRSHKVAA